MTIEHPDPNLFVTADGTIVDGTTTLSTTDKLWPIYRLVNRSASDNPSFQPAEGPCTIKSDRTFECPPVYLGGEEPEYANRQYEVTLFLCDNAAAEALRDYWASTDAATFKGLTDVPPSAQRLASVTVTRR